MNVQEIVRSLGETINSTASVKTVFGEPVISGNRVVMPVATVRCAFGGGGGSGADLDGDHPKRHGGGGGGGGGIIATPAGVVEVTEAGVRFVYYRQPALIVTAATAGFLLGLFLRSFRRA